jgi:hypothetical protein
MTPNSYPVEVGMSIPLPCIVCGAAEAIRAFFVPTSPPPGVPKGKAFRYSLCQVCTGRPKRSAKKASNRILADLVAMQGLN